jgi:hypothetical protein
MDVQPLQTGGQGIADVRKHLAQLLGGLIEESLAERQGHAAELAVEGLDTGGQRALGVGLQEALVCGSPIACEKGVGDEVGEQGKREDILVGPSVVSLENAVKEVVGGNVIEESEDGVGKGQTLTHFAFKGLHRFPSQSETWRGEEITY